MATFWVAFSFDVTILESLFGLKFLGNGFVKMQGPSKCPHVSPLAFSWQNMGSGFSMALWETSEAAASGSPGFTRFQAAAPKMTTAPTPERAAHPAEAPQACKWRFAGREGRTKLTSACKPVPPAPALFNHLEGQTVWNSERCDCFGTGAANTHTLVDLPRHVGTIAGIGCWGLKWSEPGFGHLGLMNLLVALYHSALSQHKTPSSCTP